MYRKPEVKSIGRADEMILGVNGHFVEDLAGDLAIQATPSPYCLEPEKPYQRDSIDNPCTAS